ncbi:MAG: helix-turn-helix domain-containing protein [Patescibacteria group bacterium]
MKTGKQASNDLLLLTPNEIEVLHYLQGQKASTPVTLAQASGIPRPTVYITLDKLQKRGLVESRKVGRKKTWIKISTEKLLKDIERLKSTLIADDADYRHINLTENTDLAIYQGEKTIIKLFYKLIEKHGKSRLMGIQGDYAGDAWKDTFSVEAINAVNAKIKKVGLITEIITSKDWFERQIKTFGRSWAENFGGRAALVHFIDKKYLDYESQIFIFENQLYLVSMKEKLFIEIKNQQIAKLIISLLKFVEDHSPSVDINKQLESLLSKHSSK